jgi:UDP-N-acetylglucosamine--N-acetylmuramyl-(pentapeptide) pyrophosphoryl-undecaprenol N-acetylglucosamine transferase
MAGRLFLMAGGGTGGHVVPALAVARELCARGHEVLFVGTRDGLEAKLVPAAGFEIEWIEIGGLKRVGAARTARSLWQLPSSTLRVSGLIGKRRPAALFSMGGYVAGPAMMAAKLRGVPLVVMEANAVPGFTNRRMARFVDAALLSFPEAARFFPPGRSAITGVPVRPEFFSLPPGARGGVATLLVTGGSRGSRTLNNASRGSWPLFASARRVRVLHQAGAGMAAELAEEFARSGLEGEVSAFINDMPAAFAQADVVVCRSGAGAVGEVAAAGKPAVLCPFPFAADQHQLKNAEALARAGAARLVADAEMTGERLFREVTAMLDDPAGMERLGNAARAFAHPDAARRAADALEEAGTGKSPNR